MKTTIFYYSASGNSLKLAKDLQRLLGECALISLKSLRDRDKLTIHSQKTGFIFPIYWLGPPPSIKEMIKKIDLKKSEYLFSISTYGFFGGSANFILNKWLKEQGYSLNYGNMVQMPGNNQRDLPVFPEFYQHYLFKKSVTKIKNIARDINTRRNTKIKTFWRAPEFHLNRIYFNSYQKKRIPEGNKNIILTDACNNCGICVKICPAGNITFTNKKVIWNGRCELCMACYQWCPQKAVKIKDVPGSRGYYRNPDITVHELFE